MSQSERRFSFEFFPAKTEAGHEKLLATARNLAGYKPDFFSCTYGAGGSTRDRTLSTVLQLDGEVKVPTAPHLSCVGDSKAELRELLGRYREPASAASSPCAATCRRAWAWPAANCATPTNWWTSSAPRPATTSTSRSPPIRKSTPGAQLRG